MQEQLPLLGFLAPNALPMIFSSSQDFTPIFHA